MTRLGELVDTHPMPTWRIIAWPVMIFLGVVVSWANYVELDEVSIAMGEVVPRGSIKVIQHLEGGIIEAINVEDGDIVKPEQILMELNLGNTGVNREELIVRLDSEILVRARLEAETRGSPFELPREIAERRPAQAIAEERSYEARKAQLAAKLNVQDELKARMRAFKDRKRELNSPAGSFRQQARQKELEISELQAQRTTVNNNLKLIRERFEMSGKLLADGLVPKMEHLQLEGEVKSIEGELAGLSQSIPRARAAVAEVKGILKEETEAIDSEIRSLEPSIPRSEAAVDEAKQRAREEEIRFRREAQDEMVKTEQNISRIRELLSEATEQKVRADIRSPIEGIVKNLRYHTIGGVVQPGDAIMEIVPIGENLIIEAKISPTDRGYVSVGQPTVVKISTYDFARYGGLDGIVSLVAPDTSTDEDGTPFFRILVETDKTYLGNARGELPIIPGMEATVDIHTGTRTVIEYLVKPVLKLRHEAFRER